MLTFLDLYKTLLGFVFFKLYTDAGLVYPPPLDLKKDESAAGVGAFKLLEAESTEAKEKTADNGSKEVEVDGKMVKPKDVRNTIKELANIALPQEALPTVSPSKAAAPIEQDEEFTIQTSNSEQASDLPTLHTLSLLPTAKTNLFAPYTIFLSLGTPRPLLEFAIRSFGGKVGWPETVGSGSPFKENDEGVTHVIVDRPLPASLEGRDRRRKYVQPQWIVDCINAGKLLLEEPYGQGKTLPPHLSPFGDEEGAYDPLAGGEEGEKGDEVVEDEEVSEEDEVEVEDAEMSDGEKDDEDEALPAIQAAAKAPSDPVLLRAAELAAERAGLDTATFEEGLKKAVKQAGGKKGKKTLEEEKEGEMNKMMMSNKKRKLYERMKHGDRKKAELVRFSFLFCGSVRFSFF
jgi:pescadillo protein